MSDVHREVLLLVAVHFQTDKFLSEEEFNRIVYDAIARRVIL